MSNPITKLWLWYNQQTATKRTEFKTEIMEKTGCDHSTFYRHLKTEPPKLTKEAISNFCEIPTDELYKTI